MEGDERQVDRGAVDLASLLVVEGLASVQLPSWSDRQDENIQS